MLLREPECVVGAVRADLERVERQPRVVDRGRRRGHVVDEIDRLLDLVVLRDVEDLETEVRAGLHVADVLERSRLEVVHADHALAARDQVVAQVGAEEASAAGDQGGRHRQERSARH